MLRGIEEKARERLAARPGKRPVGRRHVHFAQLVLGLLPDGQRFLGQMQRDLGHERGRQQLGIGADEGLGRPAILRVEADRMGRAHPLRFFPWLGIEPAHAADLVPLRGRDRLHGEPRVHDQHHLGELGVVLDGGERDGARHVAHGAHVDALPGAGAVLGIGMGQRRYLHDADDLLAFVRVIEEAEVLELHGAHVVARLIVAHAVPGLAGFPTRLQHLPGEHVRLGLEQPMSDRHRIALQQPSCLATLFRRSCRAPGAMAERGDGIDFLAQRHFSYRHLEAMWDTGSRKRPLWTASARSRYHHHLLDRIANVAEREPGASLEFLERLVLVRFPVGIVEVFVEHDARCPGRCAAPDAQRPSPWTSRGRSRCARRRRVPDAIRRTAATCP